MIKSYPYILLLSCIIVLNFGLQSFDPIRFKLVDFYEWNGNKELLPGLICNKAFRLVLNLFGLRLVLSTHLKEYKPYKWWLGAGLVGLICIYFMSFFLWLPKEISKFLNPLLFSPLLILGAWAFQGLKTHKSYV